MVTSASDEKAEGHVHDRNVAERRLFFNRMENVRTCLRWERRGLRDPVLVCFFRWEQTVRA